MALLKDYIYHKIKEEAENSYIQDYLEDYDADIDECVEEAINNNFEEILDDEEYDYLNEDEITDVFFAELINDISVDELEESVEPNDELWGLSPEQRNPHLFR